MTKPRVLFICTGNASRSQLAKALADQIGKGAILSESAGAFPGRQINPGTIAYMRERGVDVANEKPKGFWDVGDEFDRVVTLCDAAYQYCLELRTSRPPDFLPPCLSAIPERHEHWSIPDPGMDLRAHWDTARLIEPRVKNLIARLTAVEVAVGE